MADQQHVAGVLTVSDRCSRGESEDTSGPNLVKILSDNSEKLGILKTVVTKCVPDEKNTIEETLLEWIDKMHMSLILTTGGTGFSPRDVTPEATKSILDKEAPGLVTALISKSLEITPMAMLSRPVCGIRKQTLIVNLPGSRKGSEECLSFLLPALPHGLDLIRSSTNTVEKTHKSMSSGVDTVCPHHGGHKTVVGKRVKEDFYPVASRPRHSLYELISVDDAVNIILQNTPNNCTIEERPLLKSLNCVLSKSLIANQPFPPFPASVKDGYAVISADGPGERNVLTQVLAGEKSSLKVTPGNIVRITTGAPVPDGADAVVMVENTEIISSSDDGNTEKVVKILSSVKPGEDIRAIGSDINKGDIVLEKGIILGPSEIGLAASIGASTLNIFKPPVVAVLSTGNEVVDPGTELSLGQIYDSNRYSLLALLKRNGIEDVVDLGIAKDTKELVHQIGQGLDKCDVLITSGGVSMGEKDLLKPVLEIDFSATIHFGRVLMKPGKPTTFATLTRNGISKLIFALPGNPVSANVTFHLFVNPALKKLAGQSNVDPLIVSAELGQTISLDPRPEYHRVELKWKTDGLPLAISTGNQCSSRLLSMKSANGLLILPSKTSQKLTIEKGELVKVILLTL